MAEEYLGVEVRKHFEGYGIFRGKVIDYDREVGWFKIKYHDGDEEEVELSELMALMQNESTLGGRSIHPRTHWTDEHSHKDKRTPVGASKRRPKLVIKSTKGKKPATAASRSPFRSGTAPSSEEPESSRTLQTARFEELIGLTVVKTFEGYGTFPGIVVSYHDSSKHFKVLYTDGDVEEMNLAELKDTISAEELIGHEVEKVFEGYGCFRGQVVSYDPSCKYFRVHYEDGDEEEADLLELCEILSVK